MSHAREWSAYQEAIFAAVAQGKEAPHLVIDAKAGTGKSTTLEECVARVRANERVLVCAFNKAIADAMAARLPAHVTCKTIHSLGLQSIGRARGAFPKISQYYVNDAVRGEAHRNFRRPKDAAGEIVKLISRAKGCLALDAEAIDAAADDAGLALRPNERDKAIRIATAFVKRAMVATSGPINFDDMIFICAVQQLTLPAFDWVFVDETQDLNPAQLAIVKRLGEYARIVAVGDPNQAIYGFRGADREAMPRMVRELEAEQLPLSICYRCPTSVIADAQALVPSIEAAPTADEGITRNCEMGELFDCATPGDFVLSRTNAPLVSLCMRWLRGGVRARIRGRDVGASLAAFVRSSGAGSVAELLECVARWEHDEAERLDAKDRDAQPIHDKADCLRAVATGQPNIDAVIDSIESLFAVCDDDGIAHEFIELSSTHRSKGLEADVVWLLRDTYCQPRKGQHGISQEEKNLLYVAITRARKELIYVAKSAADEALAAE